MKIFLSKPHMSGKEQAFIAKAFESNFITSLGPQLDAFEESVSKYIGEGYYCVGLSSGTAALHLALRLVGVNAGDDVWVSSMTFAGGVFPILYQNANPIFIDLDPTSWTINCELLEEALALANKNNKLPKAIIPTDLYGQSVDLENLEALCQRYGVKLVIDSAESFGASFKNNRKCGSGGDAAILSFNGNKIITTSGGGMLVTRSELIAKEARFLATQARDNAPHYEHSTFGYNYRLSNICAAIGLAQLEVLDERVKTRRRIYERYQSELSSSGITFMPEPEGFYSSKWLTVLRIDPLQSGVTKDEIRLKLLEEGIESRPTWKPMHLQPLFKGRKYIGSGFDEKLFEQGLCLPSGSDMTQEEQTEVIHCINNILNTAEAK